MPRTAILSLALTAFALGLTGCGSDPPTGATVTDKQREAMQEQQNQRKNAEKPEAK